MSDNPIVDLDNLDLSTVETGLPLLPEGLCEVTVTKIEAKANKAGTGNNLNITLATTQPMKSVDGKDINVGFPLFDLISLTPTEKYDPRPRLAEFKEGVTGSKAGAFNPLEQYIGLPVMVRLKIEKSEEYGNKNRIARYVKKG